MFLGTYQTSFSGKNRVVLPKKFRLELTGKDEFVVTRGLDGCIWGFKLEDFENQARIQMEIPITQKRGRFLRRIFFSEAEKVELDQQGRFILPKSLLEFAQIDSIIILIGSGDHFELWSPKRWDQQLQNYA